MSAHEQFEELAAGHALHALEPGDDELFRSHLETCQECQRLLVDFSEVAAGLALTSDDESASAPPSQLWESIRRQIEPADIVVPLESKRARGSRRAWLSAAAAVVLVAAGLIGWQVAQSGSSSGNAVQTAVSDCRNTTGCRVIHLTNNANNGESAYVLIRGQDVRMATASLPALDAAHETYVLWQMPQDGRPIGLVAFPVSSGRAATTAHATLTTPYDATTAFAISREQGTTIPAKPSTPVLVGAATST